MEIKSEKKRLEFIYFIHNQNDHEFLEMKKSLDICSRSRMGKLFGGRAASLGYELSKGRIF